MDATPEDVQAIQHELQQVSHSVALNRDGTFTCRRRYEPDSTPEQFARDIDHLLTAVRHRGTIEILEKKVEGESPFFVLYFTVKFKPHLRPQKGR